MKAKKGTKAILVVSIKGGTGKTLIAANLGYVLADKGKKAAVVDADITSPNLAELMGIKEQHKTEHKKIHPVQVSPNLQMFSMALLASDRGISMEGLQKIQLLQDVLFRTEWDEKTEYFILDMPAGSSDEFKAAVKIFANILAGSIIVIQPAHRTIAERCIKLHLDNGIPILGLLENMSYYQQGKVKVHIFGPSIIDDLAKKYKLNALGKIPLAVPIRKAVEKHNGKIPENLLKPIMNIIKVAELAEPKKPGFLQRIKDKTSNFLVNILAEITLATNKEINVPKIQEQYGYAGGRYIKLVILDKTMTDMLAKACYKIDEGKLLLISKPPRFDTIIEIRIDALAHIFLNDRTLTGGQPYDLQAAYFMGHARIWGEGEVIRGLHFMKEVWNTLREEPGVAKKLAPMFKHFV